MKINSKWTLPVAIFASCSLALLASNYLLKNKIRKIAQNIFSLSSEPQKLSTAQSTIISHLALSDKKSSFIPPLATSDKDLLESSLLTPIPSLYSVRSNQSSTGRSCQSQDSDRTLLPVSYQANSINGEMRSQISQSIKAPFPNLQETAYPLDFSDSITSLEQTDPGLSAEMYSILLELMGLPKTLLLKSTIDLIAERLNTTLSLLPEPKFDIQFTTKQRRLSKTYFLACCVASDMKEKQAIEISLELQKHGIPVRWNKLEKTLEIAHPLDIHAMGGFSSLDELQDSEFLKKACSIANLKITQYLSQNPRNSTTVPPKFQTLNLCMEDQALPVIGFSKTFPLRSNQEISLSAIKNILGVPVEEQTYRETKTIFIRNLLNIAKLANETTSEKENIQPSLVDRLNTIFQGCCVKMQRKPFGIEFVFTNTNSKYHNLETLIRTLLTHAWIKRGKAEEDLSRIFQKYPRLTHLFTHLLGASTSCNRSREIEKASLYFRSPIAIRWLESILL